MNVAANHYKNPGPDDARWDSFIRTGQEEQRAKGATKQQHGTKSNGQYKPRPFVLYSELDASISKSWLIDKMLGCAEMSAWYGAPGCGKGVIIEDMALHVAARMPWHGRPITGGAVLYIALERKKLVERRAIAFRNKYKLPDLPFAIAGGVYDFRNAATADQIADICRQVEQATGETVVLIIVDTVSRALAGGDENSPKDMGALVMTAGLIQQKCPAAHLAWIHHIPHDTDRLRGHGALLGAVDTTVSVSSSGTVRKAKVVRPTIPRRVKVSPSSSKA
jgi:RecA-family ATPase